MSLSERLSLDRIDARAVALAVVRDGVESFPVAFTDAEAMEIRVLCDYRDQIIGERTRMICRLRWHLVTIAPDLEAQLAPAALKGPRICARLARQLARLPRSPRLRVARLLLKRIAEIGREERELLAELAAASSDRADLRAEPEMGAGELRRLPEFRCLQKPRRYFLRDGSSADHRNVRGREIECADRA